MRTEQKTSVKNSIGRLVFVGISVLLQVIWIINLFLWLNRYSAAISLFSTLIAVSVVFAIYGTHGNMAFKVPWMLLIAAFPIFGLCVFLLFGRSNLTRSMKKRYELIDEELFPFLNGDDEVIKELQEKDLSIANQSDYIWKYGHYPVYHNTDVAFYADASQGLEAQLAELKKYPSAVKTGRYRLVDKMNNNQLINMLRAGRQEPVHLTFNNIRTLEDFAAILSRQLGIDSTEFLQLARNAEYVKKLSFTPENFIGMFIPNTYQVYWHTPVEDFIQRMYKEYRKFWTEERLVKARKADLSPMDILILASIVEEETNIADEYPVIAGVYINRLNKGWKLEACPTLKFAWGDFSIRRVLDKHMEIDSPYNTYKNTGLPPGPVRMPSIRVIDAVLNYQHHDYMFFCAKSDFSGSHYFSRTLREHNRHANEYHRALNIKRIY